MTIASAARTDGRERVMEAALEVFSSRGFRGGSLNEIATRSGYTRAGLLHHFPSKEAVLVALLERRDAALGITEIVVDGDLTLRELADRFAQDLATVLARRDLILLAHVMTAEAGGDAHPAAEWVRTRERRLRDGLTNAAQRSIDRGELPAGTNARAVAAVVLAVVEGLESQWLVDPDAVSPSEALEALRHLVFDRPDGRQIVEDR